MLPQGTYKVLTELLVHYTHPASADKPSEDLLGLQSTLVDCLILPDADFMDSGDDLFDLTAVWWINCCQQAKQGELGGQGLPSLKLPRLFWAMLGMHAYCVVSTQCRVGQ